MVSSVADAEVSREPLPVCLSENSNRLESLWWVMQHSKDADLQALIVTCYLDESATDGGTPTAVVGGLLVDSSNFLNLDKKWQSMLDEFDLRPKFHMVDFGRDGRFSGMTPERRSAIFSRVVEIISDHNICTLAVTLDHADYKSILPPVVGRYMSQYGLCFIGCVLGNHQIAKKNKYPKMVPFMADSGTPFAEHVFFAHQELKERQTDDAFLNLGSLTFEKDENVSALQAADAVCWAVRRRATGYPFTNGFEPLEGILDKQAHNQQPFPKDAMLRLVAGLKAEQSEILEP